MDNKFKVAKKAFDEGDIDGCMFLLEKIINENNNNEEALMLKAEIFHKQQKWGDALNTLNNVLEINPKNETAIHYKQIVNSILTYWNKDTYNP